jgi:hypothetical protein
VKKVLHITAILALLLVLPSGKPAATRDVKIEVKPTFGKKDLVLEKEKYVTSQGDTVTVSRLRFYLSGFRLVFEDGQVYKESNSYHLVDAEETGSLTISLKNVPEGKIGKLVFNIGVDSVASVSGALDGDLDPARGMYWAWNSGYINAKLEGKSNQCKTVSNEFEFHVGGYLSPYYSMREVTLAVNPEQLKEKENASLKLLSDAGAWFSQLQLAKNSNVVMPGPEAMAMADRYVHMFKIAE